jgi:hypothetical protein
MKNKELIQSWAGKSLVYFSPPQGNEIVLKSAALDL